MDDLKCIICSEKPAVKVVISKFRKPEIEPICQDCYTDPDYQKLLCEVSVFTVQNIKLL